METLYVVYASDDHFAQVLGVSMISLLYHNAGEFQNIVVYVLDNGIQKSNKEKLFSIFAQYRNARLVFIETPTIEEILNLKCKQLRGSLSTFTRLFLTRFLPKSMDRVLYLDCDTLILKSLKELWKTELRDKIVAAVPDPFSAKYKELLCMNPNDSMFNAGVILIDMHKWLEKSIESKLLDCIADYNGKVPMADEGVLCSVLSRQMVPIHPKYNAVTAFFDFSYRELLTYRKPGKYLNEEDIKEAKEEPVIVHFTTSFLSRRPWIVGCRHLYADKWLRFRGNSPWKDAELSEYKPSRSVLKEFSIRVFKKMPRLPAIWLAGIMQAYGRPMLWKYINHIGQKAGTKASLPRIEGRGGIDY